MATRLYGILTDGLNKPIVNATVALLAKGSTITVLNGSEAVFRTDGEGAYNVTVQAGHYKVIIGPQGLEPYKAGEIVIYSDSPEGSLNGYLINWAPEELTPDVIKQVQQLVANSEEYALQAGRSAAAANADATDARNSKASAAQSASDALVYKNDAKASEDAAKQAQAGAAGSANTASQAVTTIEQLKADVVALKNESTDAAETATQQSLNASNSALISEQKANEASSAATRAENAAQTAEQITEGALKKDQNLEDLQNKDAAKVTLKIHTFFSLPDQSIMYSPDRTKGIAVSNEKWGFFNTSDGSYLQLPIVGGGTGSDNVKGARSNLNTPVGNSAVKPPEGVNILDFLKTSAESGYYSSGSLVTGTPEPSGWYMYKLHVHGKNDSGVMHYGNVVCTTEEGAIWYNVLKEGTWQQWRCIITKTGTIPVSSGGTGSDNVKGARSNLGLGTEDTPTFGGLNVDASNGETSAIITLNNKNIDKTTVSCTRIYNNIEDGISKTTIHTVGEGGNQNYFQIDENGNIRNINSIIAGENIGIGISNALGKNSITIGQAATGFRFADDSVLQVLYDGKLVASYNGLENKIAGQLSVFPTSNNTNSIRVDGVRSGGTNSLIGGQVEGGQFTAWRDRASGLLVEIPTIGAAVNVWKATKWGIDHQGSMDVVIYDGGSHETRLNVKGAFYSFNDAGYASGVQWVSTSDIRLKAQLKEIIFAKDKVKNLQGYTYFKRNNLEEDENSFYSEEAGLIAQDVATVLPEAVYKIGDTDFLGISYSGVIALLTNAIKEMILDAEKQSDRINKIEKELQELKSIVAKLVNPNNLP